MHDHPISHLTDLDRRRFIQASGLTLASIVLGGIFPEITKAAQTVTLPGFSSFADRVKVFKNSKYYLVESDGLPDHGMMVGIRSWQQQIPTPQPYAGTNSWPIPIKPVISKNPISAKNHFLRGAIALAVNGVPIFNALNNRGEDAFLAGELDEWGGHCGRADDYHYHIAPFHLQEVIGTKAPIAYALDGFPIYGEKEADGKKVIGLDEFNGHFDSKKNYHYHGTKAFPYINGGFKGVVTELDGQVSPQAATKGFRPAGTPLRGAAITSFSKVNTDSYLLEYKLNENIYQIIYKASKTEVEIEFRNPNGDTRREVYTRK